STKEEGCGKLSQVQREKAPSRSAKISKGPWRDQISQQHQNRNPDQGHQVPLYADSPVHKAAQPAKHSGPSRGGSEHDEGRRKWPGSAQRKQGAGQLQGLVQPPIRPTEDKGQKEKEDQRMTPEQTLARNARLLCDVGSRHAEASVHRPNALRRLMIRLGRLLNYRCRGAQNLVAIAGQEIGRTLRVFALPPAERGGQGEARGESHVVGRIPALRPWREDLALAMLVATPCVR